VQRGADRIDEAVTAMEKYALLRLSGITSSSPCCSMVQTGIDKAVTTVEKYTLPGNQGPHHPPPSAAGCRWDRRGCDHHGEVHSPQVIRDHIILPLVKQGVDWIDEAVTIMEKYTLPREAGTASSFPW
jgi:hypothetical protein